MSLWTRLKSLIMNDKKVEALEEEFELSATSLIDACENCCDTTEDFFRFLDQFFCELATMRYQIEGIQHLSEVNSQWMPDEKLPEQLNTVYASILSVLGQVSAREQMLISNTKAINHIDHGLQQVEGLVDTAVVDGLKSRVVPLMHRGNEQLIAIRTSLSQMEKERRLYESFIELFKNQDRPDLLN